MKKSLIILLSGLSLASMAVMAKPNVQEVNAYIVNGSANAMSVVYQKCTPDIQTPATRLCQPPVNIQIAGKNGNNSVTIPIKYDAGQNPTLHILSAKTDKGQKTFGFDSYCRLSNIAYGQNTAKLSDEDRKGSISCFIGESK